MSVTNRCAAAALFMVSLGALAAGPGCAGSDDSTGTVSVNLVGQAPSGAVYRLRDATIVVEGPNSTKFWNTEDDPNRTSLSANVIIGDYTATVQPGWRIEKVEGMSTQTVTAELISPNPAQFAVEELERTTVPLRFRVFNEEVDMAQGYDIVLEVEECAQVEAVCGDGVDNDCDGVVDCADPDCTGDAACPVCGNGTVEPGEQCDDGNHGEFDGCSNACTLEPTEIEPNEDGSVSTGGAAVTGNDFASANADANGAFNAPIVVIGHITPAGDEDVFAFDNPSAQFATLVRFDIWNPELGIGTPCIATIDTGMTVRTAAGAILAQNDDRNGALDRCSTITFTLAPGQRVYTQVIDFGDNNVIPTYLLQATYTSLCGNTTIDVGEQCDDGNQTGGDGCSATCQIEGAVGEIEPNGTTADATASAVQVTGDTLIAAAVPAAGDRDMFRVTVSGPTVLRVESLTTLFACNAQIAVRLLDAGGALITESAQAVGCSTVLFPVEAGTYFIQAEERGNDGTLASYLLAVDYVEDRLAEAEPVGVLGVNDTAATASQNLAGGAQVFVFGDHTNDLDVDFYTITVPAGARIRAEIIEGNVAAERCESGEVDSHVTLFDQNGVALATDDDDGRGFCSLIDGFNGLDVAAGNATATTQTYSLRVQQSSLAIGTQKSFQYRLQVTIR